jgi:uncharacterized protein (DUF58 family)
MLMWAINYSNSLAFVLTFLLAAVTLITMWHTHATLLQLRITPHSVEPVFAGQQAFFVYSLEHPDRQPRYGIALQWRDQVPRYTDIPVSAPARLELAIPAPKRGRLLPGRIKILTRFPLGLFQSWSWVTFDQFCLVYPKPLGQLMLPKPAAAGDVLTGIAANGPGNDDYAGLRHYIRGDSPRHVAWKSSARSDELLVKRFSGQQRPELWLDWQQLVTLSTEDRLSQLCQWLLKAEREGYEYGLRLPDLELAPASSETHRRRCLQALALFEMKN